jgi:release factor glutamine methyltransferase
MPEPARAACATIRALVQRAAAALAHLPTPRLDAEVLLGHTLGYSRADLICERDQLVDAEQYAKFEELVAARAAGRPIAHLRGTQEFWSLELQITDAVLVPRSETELLVALVLERSAPTANLLIADLGTGSGAIALAIASERPQALVLALERSAAALRVARSNATHAAVGNVVFVQGDWLATLGLQQFDFIVANPPYVADTDPVLEGIGLRYEPRAALVAGADGLAALRTIAHTALAHLRAQGWLLLEHGATQGAAVRGFLTEAGFAEIATAVDLADLERVTYGRREFI